LAETTEKKVLWAAQPRQARALACPYPELFYGGAKYGGKSDFLLMDFWAHQKEYGNASRGIIFRRSYNELEELITRSRELYHSSAEYSETKKTWTFKNQGKGSGYLKLRFLELDTDVSKYHGHQYSWIGFDELTEWPNDYCYIFMFSCLRSPYGAKCYMRATGNPGRIGHLWVKSRFIDSAPPETAIIETYTLADGSKHEMKRVFIPARLEDNIEGIRMDPLYEVRLQMLPSYLFEAFRNGNWNVIAGAAFQEIQRDIHCIDPINPPERLLRVFDFKKMTPKKGIYTFRSLDWGFEKPFSVGWYFTDYDGRIYHYREMYGGNDRQQNKGIRMTAREVAKAIRQIESQYDEKIVLSIADASIWDKPGNQNEKAERLPSIAETMEEEGIYFNREISIDAKKSRLQGKHQLHERLRVDGDGLPGFLIFSNCINWWRTVPSLPISKLNPEDVDTDAEDHAYDQCRYMLSARPYKPTIEKSKMKSWTWEWFEKRITEKEHVVRI
jgi:hypothetical protein